MSNQDWTQANNGGHRDGVRGLEPHGQDGAPAEAVVQPGAPVWPVATGTGAGGGPGHHAAVRPAATAARGERGSEQSRERATFGGNVTLHREAIEEGVLRQAEVEAVRKDKTLGPYLNLRSEIFYFDAEGNQVQVDHATVVVRE